LEREKVGTKELKGVIFFIYSIDITRDNDDIDAIRPAGPSLGQKDIYFLSPKNVKLFFNLTEKHFLNE